MADADEPHASRVTTPSPPGPDGLTAVAAAAAGAEAVRAFTGEPGEGDRAALLAAAGDGGTLVEAAAEVDGHRVLLCAALAAGADAALARRRLATVAELAAAGAALDGARRRAEDVRARMASLVDAGLSLGRELALDDLLTRIVQAAREVLGARYAALGVLDAERRRLDEFVTAGLSDDERLAIGDLPTGRGLLGALIRDAKPLRLERMRDDPRSVGFPPNHPPMESFLGVPITLRGEAFGNLYLTDKAGGPFTEEDEQIAQTLASQAAVAVDNLRRYEAERRRAGELESILEVNRAVLGTLDVDALLPLVARRARRLTGAETVGFAVADGDELVFRYAHGVDALGLEGSRVPSDMKRTEAALRDSLGAPVVLACELRVGDDLAGALVALGWRPFDEGAVRLLETFSGQVAIALVNARAVEAERERLQRAARRDAAAARDRAAAEGLRRAVAAQESERARVARELHDEAGQVLSALAVHLRTLEDDVSTPEARARVAELRRSVGTAANNLRGLATRLRPAALAERGLAEAIEEQAARLREAGVAVDVDLRGIDRGLPDSVQTAVFRVVQETLTNIARHSGARTASIVATVHRSQLRLVVEDDGRGFDPSTPSTHLGLAGIRERVELEGGRLRIESSPGEGTAVVVDLEVGG
ncbi:MAG: GAF domain-containing protein [Thermoleophilia bacterium]